MSTDRTGDDLYITALKWLWGGVFLSVATTSLIWLDRTDSRTSASRKSTAVVDEQPAVGISSPESSDISALNTHPSPLRVKTTARQEQRGGSDTSMAVIQAEEATAIETATTHEKNAQLFEEREKRLQAELAAGKSPSEEEEERFALRARQIVSSTSLIAANLQTRCSETVCEVNFAGQGSTFELASSAVRLAQALSANAARGPILETDELDTQTLIMPPPVATADQGNNPRSRPLDTDAELESSPPQKVRSMRFLIDVEELRTWEETPVPDHAPDTGPTQPNE